MTSIKSTFTPTLPSLLVTRTIMTNGWRQRPPPSLEKWWQIPKKFGNFWQHHRHTNRKSHQLVFILLGVWKTICAHNLIEISHLELKLKSSSIVKTITTNNNWCGKVRSQWHNLPHKWFRKIAAHNFDSSSSRWSSWAIIFWNRLRWDDLKKLTKISSISSHFEAP